VLGIRGVVSSVSNSVAWFLNSLGLQGLAARRALITLVPTLPALVVAAAYADITAVAWVISVRSVFGLAVLLYSTARRTGVKLSDLWQTLRTIAAACATAWLSAYFVAEALYPSLDGVVALTGSAVAGGFAYLACLRLLEPGLLPTALAQIRRTLSREPLPTT
jgi:hypothetical protein